MKTVLVTGADGFIGSHLVEALMRERRKVGDGESDEPEVLGTINIAARERLPDRAQYQLRRAVHHPQRRP